MTYSQDIASGLNHPDSVISRRAAIAAHIVERQKRTDDFEAALVLLRGSLRTVEQTIDLLHCAASTLHDTHSLDSWLTMLIDGMDKLADKVQYFGDDTEDEGE